LRVRDIFALNFEMRIGPEPASQRTKARTLQAERQQSDKPSIVTWLQNYRHSREILMTLSGGAGAVVPDRIGGGVGFAINGQRSESANFLLDGSDSNTNPPQRDLGDHSI
jgi:hypothetical protein